MAFQVNDGCPSPLLSGAKWVSEELGFGQTVPHAALPHRSSMSLPRAHDLLEPQTLRLYTELMIPFWYGFMET